MMDSKTKSITLVSYNSTGLSLDKQIFVNNLLKVLENNFPIICGQEHFVQSGNKKTKHLLKKVISAFPGYKCFASPAVKSCHEVTGGRAKGGLWISWPLSLDSYVSRVKTYHWRVQSIIFKFNQARK